MVKTKASVFILPMIMGVPVKYFSGFTNVFIGSSFGYGSITESTDRIFLVFKTELLNQSLYTRKDITLDNNARIDKLKGSDQYTETQVIGSYTVFTFTPSEKLIKDYKRFKEGKYSEFSAKYKGIVKRHYPTSARVNSILDPTDTDRDKLAKDLNTELRGKCEIFSSPDNIQEIFSHAKFLEIN